MRIRILSTILLIGVLTSCISTRDITYLQEDGTIRSDTLLTIQRVQPPYRLQINDVLSIQIKALDQELVTMYNPAAVSSNSNNAQGGVGNLYYTGYTVDQHGDIRVPVLGKIKSLGLTVEELRIKIEDRLLKEHFKEEANIFVTVKLDGLSYTMVGETNGAGKNTVFKDQVSVVEAIANSGGVPLTGDLTDIKIIRQYPDGVKVFHLDITSLSAVYSPHYYIQPNDLIVIDPLPQKTTGIGTTGLSTFTTIISVFTTVVATILLITNL